VRATMTASWLKQMGWDVSVFIMDMTGELETGPHQRRVPGLEDTDGTYIIPSFLNDKLKDGTALVVDLDMSQNYFDAHIPGAWYMNRSNLTVDLKKLPKAELYVLTSSDSALAQLAVYQTEKITETDAAFVQGGTDAWKAAGLPLEQGPTNLASEVNDIRLKAREQNQDMEEAMREYLAWEIELVNQMATEDDQRFQVPS
jgi:3-mercaptopyruvate sulfurtransferase SseA